MTAFGALNKKSLDDYAKLLGKLVNVGGKTGILYAVTMEQGSAVHPRAIEAVRSGDTIMVQALVICSRTKPSCVLGVHLSDGVDVFVVSGLPEAVQVS